MTVIQPRTRSSLRHGDGKALAPFGVPAFRLLWIAGIVSNIGTWMQSVGAQWQLVADGGSPAVVALVQTASAAAVLLLALPSGVLGEFLNRRSMMLVTQIVQLGASLLLVVLSALGDLPASTLLTLTFLLGAASAVQMPAAQSVISDIVPSAQVADAASLSSISVNVARAIGPALAGVVIAQFGITAVFIANAASFVVYLVALLVWRNYRAPQARPEPFLEATREGIRFVLSSSTVRALYIRLVVFLVPANALWALLPVFAQRTLGLGADGYGMLLGVLGAGAIVGAMLVGKWRARWGANGVLLASMALFGLAMCALLFTGQVGVILLALVAGGAGWIGVIATVNAVVQASLPDDVRTRGLSIYQLVLYGGTAVGAALSGALAVAVGTDAVLVGSGIAILMLTALQALRPFADVTSSRRAGRRRVLENSPGHQRVLVTVRYSVPNAHQSEFRRLMHHVSAVRYRLGACSWDLCEVPGADGELLEVYSLNSWTEHTELARQRPDAGEAAVLSRASALCVVPPVAAHHVVASTTTISRLDWQPEAPTVDDPLPAARARH